MSKLTKPFSWYGGKDALVSTLVSLLPQHRVYVEGCGGSGALLFAKEPSSLEVFNDLDSGVVNFMRVLRDPVQAAELHYLLTLTPYAREEYYTCLKHWQETSDPVEQARQWYVGVIQSMNSSIRVTGWRCTKVAASNPARGWSHHIDALAPCIERLRSVQIDHRDVVAIIDAYDSPDTCFYLDPPYPASTRRKQRCYRHEMTEEDHRRLLTRVQQVEGMVLLSGFPSSLYHELLSSWTCLTFDVSCPSAVISAEATKNQGEASLLRRTECIWMNEACTAKQQPTLFDALEGVDTF